MIKNLFVNIFANCFRITLFVYTFNLAFFSCRPAPAISYSDLYCPSSDDVLRANKLFNDAFRHTAIPPESPSALSLAPLIVLLALIHSVFPLYLQLFTNF